MSRFRFTFIFACAVLGVLAVALTAGNAFAQAKPYKVGVLPFVDNTGSGGSATAEALAKAVQTDFAHSTKLEGRVISLDGADPSGIDPPKAVQLGKAQHVDVVLVGTVIEASSEESDSGVGGVSFGGFHVGGSKHKVKATVTLQGDLYDVATGKQIDSIRISRHVTKSSGGSVSTSIGDINAGNSFDNSPIGQAFHQAASALVQRVAADQPKMSYLSGGESAAATGGGNGAPAASSPAGGAAQPNLVTTKIDFVPGDKTIFSDDFHDMPPGEPPPHWRVRNGKVNLAMGGGIRELRVHKDVTLTSPMLALPPNFTFQVKYTEPDSGSTVYEFEDKNDNDSLRLDVSPASSRSIQIGYGVNDSLGSVSIPPNGCKNPCEVDLWVQQGRLRLYFNGNRVVDVNQVKYKPITHLVIGRSWTTLGLRSLRLAKSAPDPGLILETTGKYVTHGIYFDTDSDVLKPASAGVIKEISTALYKHPDLKLEIDGYTDSTGSVPHNLDLSKRRAEAVMKVLVSQFGIDQSRLTANGFGSGHPIASNDTAAGRAQNRRVEFIKQGANSGGSSGGGAASTGPGGGAKTSASAGSCAPPVVPKGTRLFPSYSSGSRNYVRLNPEGRVAYLMLLSIRKLEQRCDRELNRTCTLPELVRGVQGSKSAFNGPTIGLNVNPACDANYTYALKKVMGGWRLTIAPRRAGLGGFLDDEGAPPGTGIYYNPSGAASKQSHRLKGNGWGVGPHAQGGDFERTTS